MAREINLLSALKIAKLKEPGMHHDGGGLYLQIRKTMDGVTRSWIYRYRTGRKLRDMGLGPAHTVSLADARRAAEKARGLRQEGTDPIEARQTARAHSAVAAHAVSFEEVAARYIQSHRAAWRNAKHVEQWQTTLATYAFPKIGKLPCSAVDTDRVLEVLRPIWTEIPVTADRLRGRIECVLNMAKALGHRSGENPARWKGHLAQLLPKRSRVRKKKHHPALPYAQMPAFMAALRDQASLGARALEFAILTAARSNEVLGMRWVEFDKDAKVWTVPAERMKGNVPHQVPLSDAALAIIEQMRPAQKISLFVFPGNKEGKSLRGGAMLQVIQRMNLKANPKWMDQKQNRPVVPNGFRSTFRDWVADETNFSDGLAEMALAHALEDETEAAYRRGDQFEKRRKLMAAWAEYALSAPQPAGG